MRKILILFAHPMVHKSRVNRPLIEAVEGMENVTVNKLYEHYPDFFIDVKHEQDLLVAHDVIIWHHPLYWYSAPAIIKEWFDLVLEHGFAYGREGDALEGKQALTCISTGGRNTSYQNKGLNRFPVKSFLLPFNQSAHLCKMNYLPPFVVHGADLLDETGIEEKCREYKRLIDFLRDGDIEAVKNSTIDYMNELITADRQFFL